MAQCRSCGAEIRWAVTVKNGKHIPIDSAPVADGNLLIEFRNGGYEARPATAEDVKLGRAVYRSHFVSCPQAEKWRTQG